MILWGKKDGDEEDHNRSNPGGVLQAKRARRKAPRAAS
jgi:hypothetical protein